MSPNESEAESKKDKSSDKKKKRSLFLKVMGFFKRADSVNSEIIDIDKETIASQGEADAPADNVTVTAPAPNQEMPGAEAAQARAAPISESTKENHPMPVIASAKELTAKDAVLDRGHSVAVIPMPSVPSKKSFEAEAPAKTPSEQKTAPSTDSEDKKNLKALKFRAENRDTDAESTEKQTDHTENSGKIEPISAQNPAKRVENTIEPSKTLKMAGLESEKPVEAREEPKLAVENLEIEPAAHEKAPAEAEKAEEPEHAADIMGHLEDLPQSYQSHRARLTMVDPERLFLNWNFASSVGNARSLAFRFRQHFFGQAVVQEVVPLASQIRGGYYLTSSPGSIFDVQFGRIHNGQFSEMFRSNLLQTPAIRPRYTEVPVWKVRETVAVLHKKEAVEESAVWVEPPAAAIPNAIMDSVSPTLPKLAAPTPQIQTHAPIMESDVPVRAASERAAVPSEHRWIPADYNPPHEVIDSQPANYIQASQSPTDSFQQSTGAGQSDSSTQDDFDFVEELVLPSVRWIGASEFILVGKPGSIFSKERAGPAGSSLASSFVLHVPASEAAVRRGKQS
jgi:hypothetical protein